MNVACGMSGFCRDVLQISALMGYDAPCSGNSLPTFRDNLSVQSSRINKCQYTLLNIWEEGWSCDCVFRRYFLCCSFYVAACQCVSLGQLEAWWGDIDCRPSHVWWNSVISISYPDWKSQTNNFGTKFSKTTDYRYLTYFVFHLPKFAPVSTSMCCYSHVPTST